MTTAHYKPLNVLVVEDQRDVADTLAMYLEVACHCRVRIAHDGEAGVAAAQAEHPDAVLCDIGLPKKDGFEVAREVTAALPPSPCSSPSRDTGTRSPV